MEKGKRNKKIENTSILIVVLISMFVLMIILTFFYKEIASITREKNMILIEEQSDNIINILRNEIKEDAKILGRAEKFINEQDKIYSDTILNALENIKDSSLYDEVGILDSYGKMYNSERKEKEFNYQDYFKFLEKDREGKYIYREGKYISDIFVDKEDSQEKLMFIVPIGIDGRCEYCIYGKCKLSSIVGRIKLSKGAGKYFQIIDNEGNYVYSSDNKNAFSEEENIWDELKKYKFEDKDSIDKIYKNIKEGKNGEFYFEYKNEGRYVGYKPIGINNWYIFSMQTEHDMNNYTRKVWREVLKLLAGIIIILATLMYIIVNNIIKSKRILTEKDEQLSVQNSIFNLVLNRIDNIPFEVDLSRKVLILYIKNKYGEKHIKEVNLGQLDPNTMFKKGKIKEEWLESYKSVYEKIINVKEIKSEIINLKVYEEFQWIRIETIIINKNNKKKHTVGIFENYNEQMDKEETIKKHIEELSVMDLKTKTDYLTSIFNREGFMQEVNYYLSLEKNNSSKDVFLILDLDNFKAINDLFGHRMGDKVLIDTANIIKSNLSKIDIVGRLAGDEFVAFIRNIDRREDLEAIAKRLNTLLDRVIRKDGIEVRISASIGIAFVEKTHNKFEDLYERADKALYDVKYKNKNGYKIYDK